MRDVYAYRGAPCIAALVIAAALPTQARAQAESRAFNVPEQPASSGVAALARQAGVQILIAADTAEGRRTRRVVGRYTVAEALDRLLADTGLRASRVGQNAYSVGLATASSAVVAGRDDERRDAAGLDRPRLGIPDILVTGRREWSLNTGIERTRDDSQPFVVFDREQIRRSGSTSLETFLRDYLNTNAAPGSTEQAGTDVQGRSSIDLRGLGARETLILVDGRRQPGLNVGSGDLEQAPVTNIPIAAIERIEVLASSAAGIYGVGASGGVVNIVLRRDYRGIEATATYADTTDFKAPDGRLDLVGAVSLEGGRTSLSFNGSVRRADPLTIAERRDLVVGGRAAVFGNNPDFYNALAPLGATPNITGQFGEQLQLKPQFGGALLGSSRTFVPQGYRGVAADGVAGLVANAGRYNLDLPPNGLGSRQPLIYGTDQLSGSVSVRRDMSTWLKLYAELAGSSYRSRNRFSLVSGSYELSVDSPSNPFQQTVEVSAPISGPELRSRSRTANWRGVGGAIVSLPFKWQAVLDASFSRTAYTQPRQFQYLSAASQTSFEDGTFDLIQDTARASFPLEIVTLTVPDQSFASTEFTAALKLAGPVPIGLPGGRPTLTLNLEHNRQTSGDVVSVVRSPFATGVSITVTPRRGETLDSAFGEVRIPFIAQANDIPLVRTFEVTIAGRYGRYRGRGADLNYQCFSSDADLSNPENALSSCDPRSLDLPQAEFRNSRFDPTVAAKWEVVPDLTLRGSYARGYLTPRLGQLIPQATPFLVVVAKDPRRGGEPIGTQLGGGLGLLPGLIGGNADVRPERSTTYSAGAILTPRFLTGFRMSADFTTIVKRDVYYLPNLLLFALTDVAQQGFETFLNLYPDRFTRGPASDGFPVGPITSIDASVINLARTRVRALDFALDYSTSIWGGRLDADASATRNLRFDYQVFPGGPVTDITGVAGGQIGNTPFVSPNLKWRGNGTLRWSNDIWSLAVRARYIGPYYYNVQRTVDLDNGAASLASQTYFDVYGSYKLQPTLTLRAGLNNALNKKPPYVSGTYSNYGDPRLSNFYLTVSKSF